MRVDGHGTEEEGQAVGVQVAATFAVDGANLPPFPGGLVRVKLGYLCFIFLLLAGFILSP